MSYSSRLILFACIAITLFLPATAYPDNGERDLDAPFILSVSPVMGFTSGGVIIHLTGRNFGREGKVTVGGRPCAIKSYAPARISCFLPPGQGSNLPLLVFASGRKSNVATFHYRSPYVASVSPSDGPTSGGIEIVARGKNFGIKGAVRVGDQPCEIRSYSHTRISCELPPGQGQNIPVRVVTGGQRSNPVAFRYKAPFISSVSPVIGPTSGGLLITITGANFGTGGTVTVGTKPCAVRSYGHFKINCELPAGQGRNLPILVTSGHQRSNEAAFSYRPPRVSSVSPNTGPTAGGAVITLTGANFGTGGTVKVGTQPCAIKSYTHTQIRCAIPPGQGRGHQVIVFVRGQRSGPLLFDYQAPVIASVSPVTGPRDGGIEVRLKGENFGLHGSVTVGGQACSIKTYTHDQIRFTLPPGEGSDLPVRVSVSGRISDPVLFSYDP